jgi:hypothetical protein
MRTLDVGQPEPFRLGVGILFPEVLSEKQHATCGQEIVDIRGAGCHKRWAESGGNIVSQEFDIQVGIIQHRSLQLFISCKPLIVLGSVIEARGT